MPPKFAQHLTIATDPIIIKVSLQLLFEIGEQCSGSKSTPLLLDPSFDCTKPGLELLLGCLHRNQRFASSAHPPTVLKTEKGKTIVILCLKARELNH